MLTAIAIENFKGIGDRVELDLQPITLLFGPNSAGKSSILHAIHYAHEILGRQNLDPDLTVRGGAAIDLGGFKNLVHGHALDRSVVIRLEFYNDESALTEDPVLDQLESASIELAVRWSSALDRPLVHKYSIGLNGKPLGRIEASDDAARTELCDFDFDHPVLSSILRGDAPFMDDDEELGPVELELDEYFQELRDSKGSHGRPALDRIACGTGWRSALPRRESSLQIELGQGSHESWKSSLSDDLFIQDRLTQRTKEAALDLVSQLVTGVADLGWKELEAFRYIGPLRRTPSRSHVPPRFLDEQADWADGLAGWDLLHRGSDDFLRDTSKWLEKLTGYEIKRSRYKELPLESRLAVALRSGTLLDDIEDLQGAFEALETKTRLRLSEGSTGLEVEPADVGVGVSQILPVVVAALTRPARGTRLIAIEQPELHVHPAVQVELGDLLAAEIRDGHHRYLLESHSEHLMLRLLRRIEETSEGELPPGAPPLTPEDISVAYVEQEDGQVRVHPLRVDETGEFIDRWPKGFFEERAEELF